MVVVVAAFAAVVNNNSNKLNDNNSRRSVVSFIWRTITGCLALFRLTFITFVLSIIFSFFLKGHKL